jgi:hypothetical protein
MRVRLVFQGYRYAQPLANGCDASGIGICLDPEGIKAISQAVEFHETPGALRIEMPIDAEASQLLAGG